jgi:hypothetical protein
MFSLPLVDLEKLSDKYFNIISEKKLIAFELGFYAKINLEPTINILGGIYLYINKSNKKINLKDTIPTYYCDIHYQVSGSNVYEVLSKDGNNIETKCLLCLKTRYKNLFSNFYQKKIKLYEQNINKFREKKLNSNVLSIILFISSLFEGILWFNLYDEWREIYLISSFMFLISSYFVYKYSKNLKNKIEMEPDPQLAYNESIKSCVHKRVEEERQKVEAFLKKLEETKQIEKQKVSYSLKEIDMMDGIKFEHFICNLFIKLGYQNVKVTKASADGGVDVIAYMDNKKVAIQCKRYGGNVGSQAVSEVYKGKDLHKCDQALIITNSNFTQQAITEAKQLGILLVDRSGLKELIIKASNSNLTSTLDVEETNIQLNSPIIETLKKEVTNEEVKNAEESKKQISEMEVIENNSRYTPKEYGQILDSILENFEDKFYDIGDYFYYELDIETDYYLEDHINKLLICGTIAIVTYKYNNSSQPYYFELASNYVKKKFGDVYEDIFIYKFFSNRKWLSINEINTRTFWEIATLIYDSSYLFTEKEVTFIKSLKDILEEHSMFFLQYEISSNTTEQK